MKPQYIKLSKYLSMVLRHKPEVIGIDIDRNGWCETDQLIMKLNQYGKKISFDLLQNIVLNDEKMRYSFNENKTKIRANQGHSIKVDLKLVVKQPPDILFHGTVERFLESIFQKGIIKGNRQYVHLSDTVEAAEKVGTRRGQAVILEINARKMFEDGFSFYLSENNIWLCDYVPAEYIRRSKMKNKCQEFYEKNEIDVAELLIQTLGDEERISMHSYEMAEIIKESERGVKWFKKVINHTFDLIVMKKDSELLENLYLLLERIYQIEDDLVDEYIIEKYFRGVNFYKSQNDIDRVINLYKRIMDTMEIEILPISFGQCYEHGVMYRLAAYYKEFGDYLVEVNKMFDALYQYQNSIKWYTVLNETEDLDIHLCAYYDRVEGLLRGVEENFQNTYNQLSEFEKALYKKRCS